MRFSLPMKAPSVANLREHWTVKAKRVKAQRRAVMLKCPKWPGPPLLVVTVTRVAPRTLDSHDNLRSAMKGFVDGIAARLGVDDGSALVEWRYGFAECAPGLEAVDVEIEEFRRPQPKDMKWHLEPDEVEP